MEQTEHGGVGGPSTSALAEHSIQNSEALTQDSILKHKAECKLDNKLRLKEVKNLEELIHFKIRTVSDQLIDEGTLVNEASRKKGLYGLRKVVDPLLSSKVFPAAVTKKDGAQYRPSAQLKDSMKEPEDSLMQDFDLSVNQEPKSDDDTLVHDLIEGVTKRDAQKLMTETGTILVERKTVTEQIDEILQLDDQDPIRKLQIYFKDGHYGHEYTEDGKRIPKQYRPPKHKNYIMQRFEDQRKRELARQAKSNAGAGATFGPGGTAFKQRSLSQQDPAAAYLASEYIRAAKQEQLYWQNQANGGQGFTNFLGNHGSMNQLQQLNNSDLYENIQPQQDQRLHLSQQQLLLPSKYNVMSQSIDDSRGRFGATKQSANFGSGGSRRRAVAQQADADFGDYAPGGEGGGRSGHKAVLEKNFLTQLKGLQSVIKESMLDGTEADPMHSETSNTGKAQQVEKKDSNSSSILPDLNPKNQQSGENGIQFHRGATTKDFKVLDDIKRVNTQTNLIKKYIPNFGAAKATKDKEEDGRQDTIGEDSVESDKDVSGIQKESSQKSLQLKTNLRRRESIKQELLEGVDSDEDILEDLVKRVEEINELEKAGHVDSEEQIEEQKKKEAAKLRQLLQLHSNEIGNLAQLTEKQRQLLIESLSNCDKKISVLSRFANVPRKDYVHYNTEQMRIYNLLNGQNDSQKRIDMLQARRKEFENKRDSTYVSKRFAQGRQFNHSAEHLAPRQPGGRVRGQQPFSNKRFVEDLSKQSVGYQFDSIADKLPKIVYNSVKPHESSKPASRERVSAATSVERNTGSQQRVRKLDLTGFTIPSREPSLNDDKSDATIHLTVSGRKVSQRKLSQHKLKQHMYSHSNVQNSEQQRVIYHRRIPTNNNSSSKVFTVNRNSEMTAVSKEPFRSSGISQLKSTMRESGTQVESQQLHTKQQPASPTQNEDLAEIHEFKAKEQNSLAQPNVHQSQQIQINLTNAGQEYSERVPKTGTQHFQNSDGSKEDSVSNEFRHQISTGHNSTKRNETFKVGGKNLEQESNSYVLKKNLSGKEFDLASFQRTKIDLKKQSQQNSIHFSDDMQNYDETIAEDMSKAEDKKLTVEEPIYSAKVDQSGLMQKLLKPRTDSNENSQAESRKGDAYLDQEVMEIVDHKDSIMSNEHVEVEVPDHHETSKPSDGVTTKLIMSLQEEPVNSKVFSNDFDTAVRTEKEKLNSSTETMKIDPITGAKDQHRQNTTSLDHTRQSKLTDDPLTPMDDTARLIREVDVPQQIEIRHSYANMATTNQQQAESELVQSRRQTVSVPDLDQNQTITHNDAGNGNQASLASLDVDRPPAKNSSAIQTSNSLALLQEHYAGQSGYESANETVDPQSFAFLKDMADSMKQQMHLRQNKNRWQAKRFKKFPRFSIYLQRDKTNTYLERNYISLNNKMLDFLAEKEPAEQIAIEETDRDSVESSEAANLALSQQQAQTIDSLNEVSRAQQDTTFNRHGASTVKDENSVQEHVPPQQIDEQDKTLQPSSPKNIQTALQTHQTDRSRSNQQQALTQHAFQNSDITLTTKTRFGRDKKGSKMSSSKKNQSIDQITEYKDGPITSIVDPFDRVLLLKNIDNAILTSFRTLTKQNNVISHTMKVIHNKFTPKILSRHVKNQYKKAQNNLYPVSEVESYGDYVSDEEEYENTKVKHGEVTKTQDSKDQDDNITIKDDQTEEGVNHETLISSVEMSPAAKLQGRMNAVETDEKVRVTHSLHIAKNIKQPVPSQRSAKHAQEKVPTEYVSHASESAGNRVGSSQQAEEPQHLKMMNQTRDRLSSPATLINENEYKVKPIALRSNDKDFKELQVSIQNNSLDHKTGESTFTDAHLENGNLAIYKPSKENIKVSTTALSNSQVEHGRRTASGSTVPDGRGTKNNDLHHPESVNQPNNMRNMIGSTLNQSIQKSTNQVTHVGSGRQSSDEYVKNITQGTKDKSADKSGYLPSQSSALKIADIINDMPPPSVYHTNQNLKMDSGRSNTNVPSVAGFRNIKPNDKRMSDPMANGQPLKIQMASVDEYLGEHKTKEQPLHPSFKTSKIILKFKNKKPSIGRATNDQGFVEASNSRHSSNSPLRDNIFKKNQQDSNTQIALNTGTSFNTGTFYDSSKMSKMRNMLIPGDKEQQSQTNFSMQNTKVNNLQTLEEEKPQTVRQTDEQQEGKPNEFQQQLDSIINQVKDIHGKRTFLPNKQRSSPARPTRSKLPVQVQQQTEDEYRNLDTTQLKMQSSSRKEIRRDKSDDTMPYHSFIGTVTTNGDNNEKAPDVRTSLNNAVQQIREIKFVNEPMELPAEAVEAPKTNTIVSQMPSNRDLVSKRIDTADSGAFFEMELVKSPQKMDPGAETPIAHLKDGLDHMLVHAKSPSVQSGLDSSIHLSNKMPKSRLQQNTGVSINNEDLSVNRSSQDQKTNFDESGQVYENAGHVDQSAQTKAKTLASKFQIDGGPSTNQQESQRQSYLIKQGGQQYTYVKVPQPQAIPNRSKSGVNYQHHVQSQVQQQELTQQNSTVKLSDSIKSLELLDQQNEKASTVGAEEQTNNEIAQRIVKPQPVQKMRQMIESLCMKEKSFVYSNPNFRADCIGTQNAIFDLESSHLVNRPGLLSKQERIVKKNLVAENQEAEFTGSSFLAGQKAPMTQFVKKPTDIRQGREHRSRF